MNRTSRQRSGRMGFTLIETLLVVSLFAMVLSAIGPALSAMLILHTEVTIDLRLQRAIDRLSDDFRRDAREARDVRLIEPEATSTIGLLSERGTITYSFHESSPDNYLHRQVTTGDGTTVIAKDDYALAPGAIVEFARAEEGQLLELWLTAPWSLRQPQRTPRRWLITARTRNQP